MSNLLEKELATPTLTGVRRAWNNDSVASGLTPTKLASILSSAASGDAYDQLTLAEEMEEREAHYGSVLRTRKLAVEGLTRTVEAADEDAKSIKIADAVQALVLSPKFDELISALLDGLGKGYGVSEIIWHNYHPVDYIYRDPRYFKFSDDDAYNLRLCSDTNPDGDPLPANKFIIHTPRIKSGIPIRGGLARMATLSYMCKSYALSDWMAFCEVFGMPIRVGKYENGAKDEDKKILKKAVASIGADAAAIIPESMQIEFIEVANSASANDLFEGLSKWLDGQISKAVLGQTMTSDNGSSRAQANVHNEVRLELVEADAKQLASTINDQLIKPFVDFNFGVQQKYPRFLFYIDKPEDLTPLVDALAKLVPLGFNVSQKFVRDKLGIPDPDAGDELFNTNQSATSNDSLVLNANTHPPANNDLLASDNYTRFVDQTSAAIDDFINQLQTAKSYDQLLVIIDQSRLSKQQIGEALALAGLENFIGGSNA